MYDRYHQWAYEVRVGDSVEGATISIVSPTSGVGNGKG
jgi:hypothetical protein